MSLDFKVMQKVKGNPSTEVAPNRRLKINPGQDYVYDLPKELIFAINKEFTIDNLINSEGKSSAEFLAEQGKAFMKRLIQEADSEVYRDRTADMIEEVARQTGIWFPHVFERYVELAILTLRPRDAWTVTEATTRVLKVRSFNCSLNKLLAEKGINNCQDFCLAVCEGAAEKTGVKLQMSCNKTTEGNGLCELAFQVQ
jgi:hypothetical protein